MVYAFLLGITVRASLLLAVGNDAMLVLRGIPAAEAVAVNPQGSPFVAMSSLGGGIARVVSRDSTKLLAETAGLPVGLAFDRAGDLYVTDRQLGSLFRIKPWGQLLVLSEGMNKPEGVAVGIAGEIFVADAGASVVYRIDADGMRAVLVSDLPGPRGIAAAADGRRIYVSDGTGTVWQFAPDGSGRKRFSSFTDEGAPAGMALDELGNLYVARDGGGKVSVLSPEGKPVREYPIPGRRVTGVAFGGYDLDILYVTEAQGGALYKLRAAQRSQRLSWEFGQALRITDPSDGAIVNRHDGEISPAGLRITVKGVSGRGGTVKVNGATVPVRGGAFQAEVVLKERENRVAVEDEGGGRHVITVLWDRDSFPRYRFSTDDNIWFLRDIARNSGTYKSIFDNPYLAFWRDMHRKYRARIHHNIYYETSGFNLSQMPDKYRSEWQANSDWMRLTFHARANDPARPYIHASTEQIREDYRLVTREIERFAGKALLSPVTTIHWAIATRAAARALRQEGVRVLLGVDAFRDDLPYVGYYLTVPQLHSVLGRDYWKDVGEDIIYIHHDMVINHVLPNEVAPRLEQLAADPHQSEVIELIIHEQYFYPEYRAYEPDYRERVERTIEWVTRRGYKPVFFEEGFLGAKPKK